MERRWHPPYAPAQTSSPIAWPQSGALGSTRLDRIDALVVRRRYLLLSCAPSVPTSCPHFYPRRQSGGRDVDALSGLGRFYSPSSSSFHSRAGGSGMSLVALTIRFSRPMVLIRL